MPQANLINDDGTLVVKAPAALASGDLIQLPDGRAAVMQGLKTCATGDDISVATEGIYSVTKSTGIVLLAGQRVFFSRATNAATFNRYASRAFYAGVVTKDAASADTTVEIDLNAIPPAVADLNTGRWDTALVNAATHTRQASGNVRVFDLIATNEAEKSDALGALGVRVDEGPIFEATVAIFDIGATNSVDINFGLATGTNATDFDSTTAHAAFHLDGNALTILAQSKDGVNNVAATSTTVSAVDDTYAFYQIDARNPASVKFYINGVQVLPATTFRLDGVSTSQVFPIVHLEKTSSTTTCQVRVEDLRLYTTDLAA